MLEIMNGKELDMKSKIDSAKDFIIRIFNPANYTDEDFHVLKLSVMQESEAFTDFEFDYQNVRSEKFNGVVSVDNNDNVICYRRVEVMDPPLLLDSGIVDENTITIEDSNVDSTSLVLDDMQSLQDEFMKSMMRKISKNK